MEAGGVFVRLAAAPYAVICVFLIASGLLLLVLLDDVGAAGDLACDAARPFLA